MALYALKVGLTCVLVVLASEIAKRSTLLGGFVASLPLVSLLAILWLWAETREGERIARLSWDIFWLVLPSLAFFVVLPTLLRRGLPFGWSLAAAVAASTLGYAIVLVLLRRAAS